MGLPKNLTTYIQENRLANNLIKIPDVDTQDVFLCHLREPIEPTTFCLNTLGPEKPWETITIPQKKTPETSHWLVHVALLHIHNNNITETSPIVLDVTPKKLKMKLSFDTASYRVADFVYTLDQHRTIKDFELTSQQVTQDIGPALERKKRNMI